MSLLNLFSEVDEFACTGRRVADLYCKFVLTWTLEILSRLDYLIGV